MGNRVLKESICISDTIEKLSWFEEVFFYRLIVNADDFGRFDGRPAIIKGRLFPLKSVTDKQVTDALHTLQSAGLVMSYSWDDKPILQIATWDQHQTVRNKRSVYPAVNGDKSVSSVENVELISNLPQPENNCNQLNSTVSNCSSHARNSIQSNPIQSESESESNPTREARSFEQFWDMYPRKKSKGDAEKAWKKISPSHDLFDTIMRALQVQVKSADWKKDGGQFIPYPATWLNRRGWEDDPGPPVVDTIHRIDDKFKNHPLGDVTALV